MKIIVAGLSRTGKTLVKALKDDGNAVTVIDIDRAAVRTAADEFGVKGVCGSFALSETLLSAGADRANLFIAATGQTELNMLGCISAKGVGCPRTAAVSREAAYLPELPYLSSVCGIDMVFDPDFEVASEIFRIISIPAAVHVLSFAGGRIEMAHIEITGGALEGKPLSALRSASKTSALVCAVKRAGRVIIPDGSFVPMQGDDAYVTGSHTDLFGFAKLCGAQAEKIKKALIVGGGRSALYLTRLLENSGVSVRIIERDADRCALLKSAVDRADVVCGDPFDGELLKANGLDTADAFVALTDREEDNAILAMYARRRGVNKIVTRLSPGPLETMLPDLGKGSAAASVDKTVSRIALTYARALKETAGSSVGAVCKIAGGGAEIVEFIAKPGFSKAGVPLMKLDLRQGLLLAGIVRGKDVLYPNGMTSICEGDRVLIVVSGQKLSGLEDILE